MPGFEHLDRFVMPDGRELSLHRRGEEFFILLGGQELMSSRAPGSEVALATLSCSDLAATKPRVLIGGLGLGFTLRAALDVLPRAAEVVVAEMFPCVVTWNRGPLRQLNGRALEDRRARVVTRDVWTFLDPAQNRPWDAVLLDVDNGPSSFCVDSNRRLYDRAGLEQIRSVLAPRGVLAVWSSDRDPRFVRRLERLGFAVRTETARAHRGRGARFTVFVARLDPGRWVTTSRAPGHGRRSPPPRPRLRGGRS